MNESEGVLSTTCSE